MYKYLEIDTEKNKLLCSAGLVGKGELVEIYQADADSPPQARGRILEKMNDSNVYIVRQTFDGHEALGREYGLGDRCIFRVLRRNMSGARRRKFAKDEHEIVSMNKEEGEKEKRIVRAKTGSVRNKRKKVKS